MLESEEIHYRSCRASGAGGQHVNKTDSAVVATHVESGLSVRIESERSQHANKRLARLLLLKKLAERQQQKLAQQQKHLWLQHYALERGSASKLFVGSKFVPKT